jgi:hypothetical protein
LDGVVRGQVAPLIAPHIPQRETVFEQPPFELARSPGAWMAHRMAGPDAHRCQSYHVTSTR